MIVADLVATLTLDDQMSAGLAKAGQNIESIAANQAKGSRAVMDMAQREVGQQIKGYGKAVSGVWDDAVNVAADYSQALADIDAVAGGEVAGQMDALNGLIKSLAAGTRFNARETAGAAEELLKAGVSYDDLAGGALQGTLDLAAAGGIGVGRAAEVLAQGLNTVGDSMQYVSDRDGNGLIDTLDKAAHFNDILAQSANTSMTDISGLGDSWENVGSVISATGQDFESGIAALTAMSAFGTEGSEGGTALKSMLNGLIKNAADIEDAGVQVFDDQGNYRDILDIFEDIDRVTADWSEGDRSAWLLDMFDAYGQKAAGQLLDYDDKTGQSLNQLEQDLLNPGAAAEAAAKRMNSYPGALETIAGAEERLQLAFAEPALEAQIPIMQQQAEAINAVADAAYDLPAPVRAGIGMMTGLSGKLLEMGGEAIYAAPGLRAVADSWRTMKTAKGPMGMLARIAPKALLATGVAGLAAGAGLAAYQNNWLGVHDAVDATAEAYQQATELGFNPAASALKGLAAAAAYYDWGGLAQHLYRGSEAAQAFGEGFQTALDDGFSPAAAGLAGLANAADSLGLKELSRDLTQGAAAAQRFGQGFEDAFTHGANIPSAIFGGLSEAAAQLGDQGWADRFADMQLAAQQFGDALGPALSNAAQGIGQFAGAIARGDFQAASDQLMAGLQSASDGAFGLLNQGGDWLAGLDVGGMLTLDDATLTNIAAAGTDLGAQIGEKLVGGLQAAGGVKDYLAQNLPAMLSGAGGVAQALMDAIGGTFADLMAPIDSMGGPGERGEAFGSAANVLSGFTSLLGGIKDGMAAALEQAFATGALPTPSADFIVGPITDMLSSAKAGVESAVNDFKAFLAEALSGMLQILDAIPGTDFAGEIYQYEQILAELQGAPIESFPDQRIDYSGAESEYQRVKEVLENDVIQIEGAIAAAEEKRAAEQRLSDILNTPAPGDEAGPDLSGLGAIKDAILPDPGYFDDIFGYLQPEGAAAAGRAFDGTAAAEAVSPQLQTPSSLPAIDAAIAAENAKQAQLQTLIAEQQETAALFATAQEGARAAAVVSPVNMAAPGRDSSQQYSYGTGSMGPAGMAEAMGQPYVSALPQVGGGLPGGDMAAQVTQMFAAAQAAAQAGMAQLQSTISTGMTTLTTTATAQLTAFATSVQTSMTTAFTSASAAAQSGMQQIVSAVQSGISQIQGLAGAAQAAGASIGQGLAAGLNSQVGAVQAAASALASAAESAMQSVIQMGSPSQMAIPYGQSIAEGLAFGMQQKSPEVQAAAEALGYSAEEGLAPLMDSLSTTGAAAGKALGLDMEQVLAEEINGLEGWDPKSQIDTQAMMAFDDAATKMARYGKRAGDQAATKAGEAFQGLADNMSAVLAGSETYLSDEMARTALKSYRRLDADAKKKLGDGFKEQLKATYDEANITIGDVIKQRMGGRLGEGMNIKGRFAEAKENILRGMLGQRTLEQKAQAAAEDGLSLAIDSIKEGLMQGGQDAQSAMKGAIDSALGGPGEAMRAGMLGGMFGGAAGSGDPEEFAWALCECISGANQEMLGSLGLGNAAETATAMLGHDLSNQIAGTGNEFRDAMLQYADANPALNLPKQFLGDEGASCISLCDQAADQMGSAAGDAAGMAMGQNMPSMPSAADFGKTAGGALGDTMSQQCVSLCGGTTDDLASGLGGAMQKDIGEMAAENVTGEISKGGARELGEQLRGTIPGAEMPGMPGASPDDLAAGVADGMTQDCVSLCDDSGMGDAASSLDSAAGGMADMGGQIEQLTNSLIGQKFSETLNGIKEGLSGGQATGGIPSGVDVPEHILKLNPNINRALNFDISQTNPHAAALLGGASPVHLSGGGNPFGGGTPSGFQGGGGQPIELHTTVELDGQAVGHSLLRTMTPRLSTAAQNRQRNSGMVTRR